MKLIKNLILIILIVLVILALGKNLIAKIAIENGVTLATGVPLSIQDFRLQIVKNSIEIKGLVMHNPKGFDDKVMIDMPEIYVGLKVAEILKNKIHVEAIKINLSEFQVIKNREGKLNLDALKPVSSEKAKKEQPAAPPKPKEKAKGPALQMDLLELKVGKVVYKDYSGGGEPSVKTFNINLNEQFRDVTNIDALVRIILVKALAGTTIGQLTNLDLGGLASSVSGTLASSTQVLASEVSAKAGAVADATMAKAGESFSAATKGLEAKIPEGASDTVKKTGQAVGSTAKKLTSGLTSKMKLPFGEKSAAEETKAN